MKKPIALAFAIISTAVAAEEPAEQESRLLGEVRQLTFAGKRAGEGYFSKDGKEMIFQSEREEGNPFFQIYRMDLETGDTERISPGHGKTTCAWIHPGGGKVLFASTQDDPNARSKQDAELKDRAEGKEKRYSWDYDPEYDIYSYDLETKQYVNLTNTPGYDAEGCYSPDGSMIVFGSNRLGYSDADKLSEKDREWFALNPSFLMDLFIMNADGSNVRQLTTEPGYDGGPFFSADGKQICWRRFNPEGDQAEIHTMNTDGTGQRQLTGLGAMSWAPFFHPSGEYLIFATNLNGFANFELYLVDAAGTKEPVRVTWTEGFDGLPAFSPDGTRLAWTSNRTGNRKSQIFLADWNHSTARELLRNAAPRKMKRGDGTSLTDAALSALKETRNGIAIADLRAHIEYLASPELNGRLTGTEGEQLATAYVAAAYEHVGLVPYDSSSEGYFHPFEFTAGVDLGENNSLVLKTPDKSRSLKLDDEWRPLSFSELGTVEPAGIVFAGYGIEVPEGTVDGEGNEAEAYTSYYHLDVKDKWVMMLRFVPQDVSVEERRKFNRFSSLRYKAMIARQKGARGVIFITGPRTDVKNELVGLSFDASMADSGITVVSLGNELGAKLVKQAGKDLEEIQATLDKGEMTMGFPIPDTTISATIDIIQQKRTGRNVIARLEAENPEARKQPAVLIGAHVDHLGDEGGGGSRATGKEASKIHFGADDNASGVAAMLEIAQYLASQQAAGKLQLKRDIVFAAWSGEEIGLLGSSHFVRETAERVKGSADSPLGDLFAANLNLDMVGRLEKALVLQGVASSPEWPQVIEQRNAPVGLPIKTQNDTYLATDATSFYLREVPILSVFTGAHDDYHTPNDTPDKINYEGAEKITRFVSLVARGLATSPEAPEHVKVERPAGEGRRANLRAYLGTIPDYSQGEVEGVKLSGASKGGPADKAGIKAGDVVVSLAGKEVKNIYDYTYILEAIKPGEKVEVSVVREGKRITLEITPGSRQ